jgi:ubiquinone/menaquinone biosynthesis C-methylase UbiE
MDFRTPRLDALAEQVIPADHFVLSSADARDTYFADTRMLDAKQLAHNRFRTNPRSLTDHLIEALALRGTEELLDLGCGNGFVLEHLRPHLTAGHITGLDIAPGVLEAARRRLAGVSTPCTWIEGSADDLSMLADSSFDRVMATYMAHYVPDLDRCFAEVRRVLRPGGRFLLTTDRPDSMVEMWDVHFASLRELDAPKHLFRATPKARISLGNGTEQLSPHFASVETRTWQDQLQFADADPFLAFYRGQNHCCASSAPGADLPAGFFTALEERVRDKVRAAIEEHGYFAVTKYTGTFVCS